MLTAVLQKVGAIRSDEAEAFKDQLAVPVLNRNRIHTGDVTAIDRFLAF